MCFLMETRIDKDSFNDKCRELPFQNKLIVKKPNNGGRMALLWKTQVQLDVVNYTDHHILAKVVEDDGFEWMLTCF